MMGEEGSVSWYRYTRHHDFEQEVGPDDTELPGHHSHYSYLERIKDPMTVDDILAERSKTHGSFAANALVAQRIKEVFHGSHSWAKMTDEMRESLDLIALKLSRILTADPAYKDNWVDVGGYAQLVARSLE